MKPVSCNQGRRWGTESLLCQEAHRFTPLEPTSPSKKISDFQDDPWSVTLCFTQAVDFLCGLKIPHRGPI